MSDHTGLVPVDSGLVLCVDPGHLPVDVLQAITQSNSYGVTVAVVAQTRYGDGWYDPFAGPDWHKLSAAEVKDIADGWAGPQGPTWKEVEEHLAAGGAVCTGCGRPLTLEPGEDPCCGMGATRRT